MVCFSTDLRLQYAPDAVTQRVFRAVKMASKPQFTGVQHVATEKMAVCAGYALRLPGGIRQRWTFGAFLAIAAATHFSVAMVCFFSFGPRSYQSSRLFTFQQLFLLVKQTSSTHPSSIANDDNCLTVWQLSTAIGSAVNAGGFSHMFIPTCPPTSSGSNPARPRMAEVMGNLL